MPDLPPRVTMPLLTLITQQSLDEDYQHAAERRAGGAPPPHRPGTRRVAAAVIAVFGVLVSTAFVQNTRNVDVDNASRSTLIERITSQRERVDAVQADIAELTRTNADLNDQLTEITDDENAVTARLRGLQVQTGFVPVRGEGVRVVVESAPDAVPNDVLRDSDLALLANGFWSAGAEAIAIDGQRLTALSAIRNTGTSIEVNSVGISEPYFLEAIGDSGALQANFFDTSSGLAFDSLARQHGFLYELDNDDALTLPGGPTRFLRLRSVTDGTTSDAEARREGESVP